jgi:membrane-associated phospholipid phosphatase
MRVAAGKVMLLMIMAGMARICLGKHFLLDVLGRLVAGAVGDTAFTASSQSIVRLRFRRCNALLLCRQ